MMTGMLNRGRALMWAALLPLGFVVGCGVKSATFEIDADRMLNACGESEGYPLWVRFYSLTDATAIEAATLDGVWGDAETVLRGELVGDYVEKIIKPGDSEVEVTVPKEGGATHVAVVGNYCRSTSDCWRWVSPFSDAKKVKLRLEEDCIAEKD